MENKKFAPREIWDNEYKGMNKNLDAFLDDQLKMKQWLQSFLKSQNGLGKSVLEIGCFPGRHLYLFGEKNYELNGIDITEELNENFSLWLKSKNFNVNNIKNIDVFKFNPDCQFDVVCSFGFIEHFSNYLELIEKHIEWTKPNGHIIITVPDFRNPVQNILHKYIDQELLDLHNLDAMRFTKWNDAIKKHNVKVIFKGHFGGFEFWAGEQHRNWIQKKILKVGYVLNTALSNRLKISSKLYSPYFGIILKKMSS